MFAFDAADKHFQSGQEAQQSREFSRWNAPTDTISFDAKSGPPRILQVAAAPEERAAIDGDAMQVDPPTDSLGVIPSKASLTESAPGHDLPSVAALSTKGSDGASIGVGSGMNEHVAYGGPFVEDATRPPTREDPPRDTSAPPPLNGLGVKAHSRKKKKKKGMKPGAPAASTVRGFTPIPSGDEDSDYSTVSTSSRLGSGLKGVSSGMESPFLRPSSACSQPGVSALKLQLDTLNLDGAPKRPHVARTKTPLNLNVSSGGDSSSGSPSEGGGSPMTTYEIPLEHDFVSPELGQKSCMGAIEGGLVQDNVNRKMSAADFDSLHCLGKGSYGTVLLVKQASTGRLYAQKQFRKASLTVHKKLVEQTKTERSILESVNRHPFVVKLYYAFQDHEKLYLILEYAQGGELFTHLAAERMFTEEVASFYMAEMVLALEHLHRNVGVVYRDLKPENCLLDSEGHLLLTDFGLSKVAVDEQDHCKSILGTIEYMAPEVVLGNRYGAAVDWWSLGALGFDLLTGGPPFQGNNHAKVQEKILKQKLNPPYFLGPDAKDLLTRLLRKEPNKRLGGNMPKDLQTIKKHRFFRKIDWKTLENREIEPPIKPLITDPELAENFSTDFTELAVSPVVSTTESQGMKIRSETSESDPFGGFSFVASSSLLECGDTAF